MYFNTIIAVENNEYECTIDQDGNLTDCFVFDSQENVMFSPEGLFLATGRFPDVKTVALKEYLENRALENLAEYGGWSSVKRDGLSDDIYESKVDE